MELPGRSRSIAAGGITGPSRPTATFPHSQACGITVGIGSTRYPGHKAVPIANRKIPYCHDERPTLKISLWRQLPCEGSTPHDCRPGEQAPGGFNRGVAPTRPEDGSKSVTRRKVLTMRPDASPQIMEAPIAGPSFHSSIGQPLPLTVSEG